MDKIFLDCSNSHEAQTAIELLEKLGFDYGYGGVIRSMRRATSNMPYIVIDLKNRLYWGSKGREIGPVWVKLKDVAVGSLLAPRRPFEQIELNAVLVDAQEAIEQRQVWIANRQEQIDEIKHAAEEIQEATTRANFEVFKKIIRKHK